MKKRPLVFFSAFVMLGGLLLASSGNPRKAFAAPQNRQSGEITLGVMAHPPAKMCVGEKAWAQVIVSGKIENKLSLTAASTEGTLSKMNWTWDLGPKGGVILGGMARTMFTATEAGDAKITFLVSEGGSGKLAIGFKVIDCNYEIQFSATETVHAEDVSYQITMEGNGLIDAHDMIYGEGTYSFSLLVNIAMPKEGTQCTTTIPSTGKSSFTVKGSRTDTGLNISLEFRSVNLGGGKVKCVDKNGRESDFPPVFEGNVNPDEAISLTNVNVAPYQAYKWTFGKNGRGFLAIIPRRKS